MRVSKLNSNYQAQESRTELGSHADVTVVGKHALVLTDLSGQLQLLGTTLQTSRCTM